MITLIGVGHVFDIENQVKRTIVGRMPSVVCVELDETRFHSLISEAGRGSGPIAYNALAFFQKWIARKYGAGVGREMIAAIDSAREIGADIAFIDMEATDVFRRFWKGMSFNEKVKMAFALISSLFVRKRSVEREIRRFEDDNEAYLEAFGEEFPSVKKILIDDRDVHMARAIERLSATHENIVAVIGDGHVEGVRNQLKDQEVEVVRLRELRSQQSADNVTFSFSIGEHS
ncbi:MAG: TraB/GumN family protein [Thermoplasmata archaeon]